jgi:transcriptional regulator with XRE-family HTH domain
MGRLSRMTSKPRNLSDQVRDAVRDSGLLAQEVANAAKIDKGAMSRFLSGERGLSMAALDRIGGVLGLSVVARKKRAKLGKG